MPLFIDSYIRQQLASSNTNPSLYNKGKLVVQCVNIKLLFYRRHDCNFVYEFYLWKNTSNT